MSDQATDEYARYELKLSMDVPIEESPAEPDGYCTPISGSVRLHRDEEDEDEAGVEVGQLEAILIRMPLSPEGYRFDTDVFEVFDAHSGTLCDLYSTFFTARGVLRKAVEIEHGDFPVDGILYVESLTLDPSVRRKGLGLKILWAFLRRFNYVSLVVLEPAPLNGDSNDTIDARQRKEGVKKLRRYWAQLGFERLTEKWMYLDPCKVLPNPFRKGLKSVA